MLADRTLGLPTCRYVIDTQFLAATGTLNDQYITPQSLIAILNEAISNRIHR
jgi:hypothetical protein